MPGGWRRKASRERCLNLAKVKKLSASISSFRRIFPFPAFPLFSLPVTGRFGSLHADAHMRPPVVVKVDKLRNLTFCVLPFLETLRPDIDPLCLDGSVHPFRHGIVGETVVLRHADGDVVCPELAHIQVAAVLYAPVRMVNQPFGIVPARLCNGHPEGFQREEGAERGGKRPACYLVGMAVGHQMQAAVSPSVSM